MAKKLKRLLAEACDDVCESLHYRRHEFLTRMERVQSFGDGRSFQLERLTPQVDKVRRVLAEAEADLRAACDVLMNVEAYNRAKAKAEMEREHTCTCPLCSDEYDSELDGATC